MMQRLTIDTLEKIFVYLGCANIVTQSAMDGAIPLESIVSGDGDKTIAQFVPSDMDKMKPDWNLKSVWLGDDNLNLATVANIHWSTAHRAMGPLLKHLRRKGEVIPGDLVSSNDGFFSIYYSSIDKFGVFEKFKIQKRKIGEVFASRLYNPSWVFSVGHGSFTCLRSDNDDLLKVRGVDYIAPMLCGFAQSIGHHWQVKTKFDDVCPMLTLLTDPTGVKEFWRLRDIPVGKKRRDALLHWVNDHWRQDRRDPEVEVYVRKHMRGAENITHGSFKATIIPSERDTLDEEIAKSQRDELRARKADKRKRSAALKIHGFK